MEYSFPLILFGLVAAEFHAESKFKSLRAEEVAGDVQPVSGTNQPARA
jgi:hypothetical protein